jgi:hypothetical protein
MKEPPIMRTIAPTTDLMSQLLREQRITNRLLARLAPRPEPGVRRQTAGGNSAVVWFVLGGIGMFFSLLGGTALGCGISGCLLVMGYLAAICGHLESLIRCSANYDVPLRDESPDAPPCPPATH